MLRNLFYLLLADRWKRVAYYWHYREAFIQKEGVVLSLLLFLCTVFRDIVGIILVFLVAYIIFKGRRLGIQPLEVAIAAGLVVMAMLAYRNVARLRATAMTARFLTTISPLTKSIELKDERPLILYLRSFQDDRLSWRPLMFLSSGPQYLESELVAQLSTFGPCIALGEDIDYIGMTRIESNGRRWRKRVLKLMQRAQLVLIMVNNTRGLKWEIEQALAKLDRRRVVFINIPRSDTSLRRNEDLEAALVDELEKFDLQRLPGNHVFTVFRADTVLEGIGHIKWYDRSGSFLHSIDQLMDYLMANRVIGPLSDFSGTHLKAANKNL
jgi:hypothetical protein